MRYATPLTAFILFATSAFAAPKRDANSLAASSLEAASGQLVIILNNAVSQIHELLVPTAPSSGILAVTIANIENNIAEGIQLFQNIAAQGSDADARSLAASMQTELTSLTTDLTGAQGQLKALEANGSGASSLVSVNGINELLGSLVPGISDLFNQVAETVEGLGLPSLPK